VVAIAAALTPAKPFIGRRLREIRLPGERVPVPPAE
jgi:hypothetical protein